jgi:hypothetical protein
MSRAIYRINPNSFELEELYNSESKVSVHAFHADEMAPTEHPATGKIFTSRAKFNEETFRSGCVPAFGCDKPVKKWESNAVKEEREHREFNDNFDRAYNDLDNNNVPRFRMDPQARALWMRNNGRSNE